MPNIQATVLCAIFTIAWVYALSIFKRKEMSAFFFAAGVAGAFLLGFVLLKEPLTVTCAKILEYILLGASHFLKFYEVYPSYNVVFVNSGGSAISLFIDYECSGTIEAMVLLSVVAFFPKLSTRRRLAFVAFGFAYTMVANAIRMVVVCATISRLGSDSYYIAHSIMGRVVFYVLTILLYFYLLTWRQIKTQITGRFSYGDEKKSLKN